MSKYLDKDKDKSLNGLARYLPEARRAGSEDTEK